MFFSCAFVRYCACANYFKNEPNHIKNQNKYEPNLSVVVNKRVRRCLLAEHEVRRGTGCYTNVAERLSARYRHGDVYRNAEPDIHWHAVCACH